MGEQKYEDDSEQTGLDPDSGSSTSVEAIPDDDVVTVEEPEAPAEPDGPTAADDAPASSEASLYCPQCGAAMGGDDSFCGGCGWRLGEVPRAEIVAEGRVIANPSSLNRLTALLLCLFLGWLGAHRYYVGKIGTGLLFTATFGLITIGTIYDFVMIVTGEFTDSEGRRLHYWQ